MGETKDKKKSQKYKKQSENHGVSLEEGKKRVWWKWLLEKIGFKTGVKENELYTVSQKNDTDVVHYNFNVHQLILVIFGRDIAEWICY